MSATITGLFVSSSDAAKAAKRLSDGGMPRRSIHVLRAEEAEDEAILAAAGVPDSARARCRDRLGDGHTAVCVTCAENEDGLVVRRVLRSCGADEILHSTAPAPLTIAANRLPVARASRGSEWRVSPGGLVSALTPVLRESHGTWVGWHGVPDAEIGEFEVDGLRLRGVPLSQEEVELYYSRFANETLWPLFHDAIRAPQFCEDAWEAYKRVNRRFAETISDVTPTGGTVWVQDYHLLLVPGILAEMRPDMRIGLFIHIPVPPGRLFAALPWRDEILRSLSSAHLVGTQIANDSQNLRSNLESLQPTTTETPGRPRKPTISDYAISIDSARIRDAAVDAERTNTVATLRQRIGGDRTIFLGVDRLDYTKGIDLRLEAFRLALDEGLLDPADVRFVQVAVPSRGTIDEYKDISDKIDALVGEINGRFAEFGSSLVEYRKDSLDFGDLVPLYRMADVMVVTPVRDGMNLVAKEYLATRYDGTGELILSEFAGCAQELREATMVNPHDIRRLAEAYREAHRRRRLGGTWAGMSAMHEHVMTHDVYEWSRRFLDDLRDAPAERADADQTASPGSVRGPFRIRAVGSA